ncbi:MAG TPA: outer membrane lipoprotein carrier protein LolA [Micavibrio sp.]|nr:outer membrane lipoprotein carrier protein LolA [Micavibrio sp.]
MKHLIFALLGVLMFASPALAQVSDPEVKKAEDYLQSLKTLTADFIQTSTLGSRLSGKFYLNRPGKMRFDYNEVEDFIVADGVFVYFYDSQLQQQSNAPIGQTLADFLLRKDLSLHDDLKVVQLFKKNGYVSISVVQKDNPAAGEVELIFSEVPYQLERWRVKDPQGETTEVVLKNLKTGMEFKDVSLFGYKDPKGRKAVND